MKKRLAKILCIFQAVFILTGLCGISVSAAGDVKVVNMAGFKDQSNPVWPDPFVFSSGNTESGQKTIAWNGWWYTYSVKISTAGEYDIYMRAAGQKDEGQTGQTITVEAGGKSVSGTLNAPGGWDDFTIVSLGKLSLKSGENIIKVSNTGVLYYDYMQIGTIGGGAKKTEGAYRNTFIPAVMQGEDFDMGIGSFSNDGKNTGDEMYREGEVMDVYKDISLSSGYYLSLGEGEYASYTFNAEFSDMYTLKMAYRGSDSVAYYMDGQLLKEDVLKITNAFSEQTLGSMWIDKGEHTFKIKPQKFLEIDYIRFDRSESEPFVKEKTEDEEETEKKPSLVWRELYVSENGSDENVGDRANPFKTLKRAADEIAQISGEMQGDIAVNIDPGYYFMDETVELTNAHGGKNGYSVIFKSTDANERPVISGGVKIEGWEKTENKIWKAKAENLEEAGSLFVNGFMAQRARSKYGYNTSTYYNNPETEWDRDGYTILGPIPDFKQPENVEMVSNFLWISHRIPLADVREAELEGEYILEADNPYFQNHFQHWGSDAHPDYARTYYFENDIILLDQPGEWYFDKNEKMMYYYPYNEEDMTTAEAYVPVTEKLVTVCGESKDNKVENISFEGLDFRYGAWKDLAVQGICIMQSDHIYETRDGEHKLGRVPAQVEVDFASGINITDCNFECMEASAVKMQNYVTYSNVTGSTFHDIAGCGVSVDNPTIEESETVGRCSNINITDNVMMRMSGQLLGLAAVMCYYGGNVKITYNDIYESGYSGVSLGWGWGNNSPACHDNEIANNDIRDFMKGVRDGAAVYFLGNMPGTTVHGNYVKDSGDHRGGLYMDNGTGNTKWYGNVVENNKETDYYVLINSGAYNNEYTGNYINTSKDAIITSGNNVHDNIFIGLDDPWPQEALDIIAGAGARKGRETVESLALPEWRDDLRYAYKSGSFLKTVLDSGNIINVEDFMDGGEGAGYHMTRTNGNKVDVRADTAVDLYHSSTVSGGYDLGLAKGEWVQYKVKIKESGNYSFYYYTQNNRNDGVDASFNLYMNGELIIKDPYLRPTPNPTAYALNSIGGIYLEAGEYVMRYECATSYFGTTYFMFVPEGSAAGFSFDEGALVEQKYKKHFADMEKHWAKTEVEEMENMGYLNGVGEDKFAPDNTLSLYQCLWIALRICGKDSGEGWQEEAYDLGLIDDVNIADRSISREETAEILMKVYLDKNGSYKIEIGADTFSDMKDVDIKYANAVLGANSVGLFKGDTNGKFNPKSALTRAEAATIFYRLLNIG